MQTRRIRLRPNARSGEHRETNAQNYFECHRDRTKPGWPEFWLHSRDRVGKKHGSNESKEKTPEPRRKNDLALGSWVNRRLRCLVWIHLLGSDCPDVTGRSMANCADIRRRGGGDLTPRKLRPRVSWVNASLPAHDDPPIG